MLSASPDDAGLAPLRARLFGELRASGWAPAGPVRGRDDADAASDAALLTAFVGGDAGAFDTIFERHAPLLNGHARRWLRGADAEDVVQEAFLVLFQRAEELLDRDEANVGGFLFVTLRNKMLRRLARAARETLVDELETDDTSPGDDGLAATLRREEGRRVALRIERTCNPLEAQVVLLDLEDVSDAEIARRIEITPGHVRVLRHRAYAKLRRVLREEAT
jgi:RNA polymerase sigma-70 factor (ECF subfamily)